MTASTAHPRRPGLASPAYRQSTGGLVSAFNGTGKMTFHTGSSSDNEEIRAEAISPDGEIYVTGNNAANCKYFLARITPAGALDSNFNTGAASRAG